MDTDERLGCDVHFCTSLRNYTTSDSPQHHDLNTDRSEHLKSRQGIDMLEASRGPYTRRESRT